MQGQSKFRSIPAILQALLVGFFTYLMLRLTIPYFSFKTDVDFLLTKQGIIHILPWRWSFYLHITFSLMILFAGAFQFSAYIRKKYRKFHRFAGYIYIVLIIFVSGPAGFIMGLYANGGLAARVSFSLLALLWILFTAVAWKKVLQADFETHRKWMIRSYALTFSAITLRLMLYVAPMIALLPPKPLYVFVAWSSWMLNLGVAELIIYRTRRKKLRHVIQAEAL